MDLFLKVLLILFGVFFFYVGLRMVFRPKRIIQGIQKYKYKMTAEPRPNEILFSRILGGLLMVFGLYFSAFGIYAIFI